MPDRRRDLAVKPLAGGVANVGAVVRLGDTVRRPTGPHSAAVHAFLAHLEASGFDGAPRFLGIDDEEREVLSFLPGDVAIHPYPAWVGADDLLDSVAVLQRRCHEAARTFRPPDDAVWIDAPLPGDARGSVVCHTDICVENVVVRSGRAVALIDFDYARPVDPLFDIAVAARHWVPMRDPADLDQARRELDSVERFRRFGSAHRLTREERSRTIALLVEFLDLALDRMRRRAEGGHPGFTAIWADGYAGANRRARAWVLGNRRRLEA